MPEFVMSAHALKRAVDMGLDGDEIRDAALNPRSVSRAGAGKEYRTRGKVTVVLAYDTGIPTVTTVLWATAAGWVADGETTRSRGAISDYGMRGVRSARRINKKGGRQR